MPVGDALIAALVCCLLGCCAAGGAPAPVDILFVLDVSANMLDDDRFVVAGARAAMFELAEGDRAGLVLAGRGVVWRCELTGDRDKIERGFQRATSGVLRGGKRRLYDAVWEAAGAFPATADGRRRFVVLIANEDDRGSGHRPEEVVGAAKKRSVVIQVVLIGSRYLDPSRVGNGYPRVPHPDVGQASERMRFIAEPTGGAVAVLDTNGYVLRRAVAACKYGAR